MSLYLLVSPQYGFLSKVDFRKNQIEFSDHKADGKKYISMGKAQIMCNKILDCAPKTFLSVKNISECPMQVKTRKFNLNTSKKVKAQLEKALIKIPTGKARLYVAINIPIAPQKVSPATLIKLTGLDRQKIMNILRYLDETESCFIEWGGGWYYKTEEDMLETISALEKKSGYKLGDAMKAFDEIESFFDESTTIIGLE